MSKRVVEKSERGVEKSKQEVEKSKRALEKKLINMHKVSLAVVSKKLRNILLIS